MHVVFLNLVFNFFFKLRPKRCRRSHALNQLNHAQLADSAVLSTPFQIVVGIALMILGTLDINDSSSTQYAADIVNNITIIVVFIITVLNVIIAAFSIENTNAMFVKAQPVADKADMMRLEIIR